MFEIVVFKRLDELRTTKNVYSEQADTVKTVWMNDVQDGVKIESWILQLLRQAGPCPPRGWGGGYFHRD